MNNFSKISDFSFASPKIPKYCRKSEASTSKNRCHSSKSLQERTLKAQANKKKGLCILQNILIKKLKQAFNYLFTGQKTSKEAPKIKFLPIEHHTEYLSHKPNLLELVKKQKYQSYIKFKAIKSQFSSQKVHIFTDIVESLCNCRKNSAFLMLSNFNQRAKNAAKKQMILQSFKVETQASEKFLNNLQQFQREGNQKNVKIFYQKIKIVNFNEADAENKGQTRKTPQKTKYICLKDLQRLSEKKQYSFHTIANKLTKKHYPTILE